jgi:glutathione peroxidase
MTTAIPGRRSAMAKTAPRGIATVVALGLALSAVAIAAQAKRGTGMSAYDFIFTSIDGAPLPLARYRGQPLLVVNTASFCGFTRQYEDLEALWRRYRERGLVVIGVPSNDFGQQEPGSEQEIRQFCETRYAVDFPLTDKQDVIGPQAHPFFRWISAELGEAGTPRWNFHKYLVGPDGLLEGAWPSSVRPTDRAVTDEIERLLPAKTAG